VSFYILGARGLRESEAEELLASVLPVRPVERPVED